jgi:protein gp37
MGKSLIEWTDKTWNPLAGCEYASDGCTRCYAARDAAGRLAHTPTYQGLSIKPGPGKPARFTGEIRLLPDRLDQPLKWRDPCMVFVNSMSDLFHRDVPAGYILRVFQTMGLAHWHTFQVLTKRPQRMAAWTERWALHSTDADADGADGFPPLPRGPEAVRMTYSSPRAWLFADMLHNMGTPPEGAAYPPYDWQEGMRWWPSVLPNIRWGTSIESDPYAFRADHLRRVHGALRFLSMEPLLGAVPSLNLDGIGWVIVGGESGPGARPMHPAWVRDIQAKCLAAGVPFFFKQWGEWVPESQMPPGLKISHATLMTRRFVDLAGNDRYSQDSEPVLRVGKKAAGALLDGREWRAQPDGD